VQVDGCGGVVGGSLYGCWGGGGVVDAEVREGEGGRGKERGGKG